MSILKVDPRWNNSVNQLETDEYILGGPNGNINLATRQLAENIFWLKEKVDDFKDSRDYRLEKNRKDLEYNGLPATDGSLPVSLADELSQNFEDSPGLYQRAKNVGECQIFFTTEMSANYVAPCLPFLDLGAGVGRRRILPVTFGYNVLNSAVSLPLFKPTRTNGNGFLTFKYIGKKPLHTLITGGMHFLYKDTNTVKDGFVDIIPWLVPLNPPKSEAGQGGGKRALGFSSGYGLPKKTLVGYSRCNDLSFPINKSIMDYVNSSSFNNLYEGSDIGYFSASRNPNEEALITEEQDSIVNENTKTTKWIDILGNNNEQCLYVMIVGGSSKSSRSRIQYKDIHGNIVYYRSISGEFSSQRLFRLPKEAAQVRIYYSGTNDDIKDEDVKFGALPSTLSFENDPLLGLWSERHVFINRQVVFYPGVEYAFEMYCMASRRTDNTLNSSTRDWGFRFQSGGMKFLFDATDMVNELAAAAWSE